MKGLGPGGEAAAGHPGNQPDVSPSTTVFFDAGLRNNAKYFPFCNRSEVDGVDTIPAKCVKAEIGKGSASADAGTPGAPPSLVEPLDVLAMNGPKGKSLWLIVRSKPGAPVPLKWTVIPGTVARASGVFGFSVRFDVPPSLQNQLGLDISLTDFNVKISGTPRKVKVGKVFKKISYLQIAVCKKTMHSKAIVTFRDHDTGQPKSQTSATDGKC